jgi:hypothetical protein
MTFYKILFRYSSCAVVVRTPVSYLGSPRIESLGLLKDLSCCFSDPKGKYKTTAYFKMSTNRAIISCLNSYPPRDAT